MFEQAPDHLGLPFALWTSRTVRELIERRLEKRLGLTAVQLYVQRWGLTPQKPLIRAKERQPAVIAAVSNRGLIRFMLHEDALNADLLIAFLRRLTKDASQKMILIVDNLKVHKAGKVQARVASHAHEIELVCLRAYAPDHNPTEHLNNDLKQKLRQQPRASSKED